MTNNIYHEINVPNYQYILERPSENHLIDLSWEAHPFSHFNFNDQDSQATIAEFYRLRDLIEEHSARCRMPML